MQSNPETITPKTLKRPIVPYYPHEEFANALSHGLGMLAAIVATVFMLMKAAASNLSHQQIVGVAVYGISMIVLFLSSTLYHSAKNEVQKTILNRLDHCAIYLLIAGSYTPFLMITLHTTLADVLLVIIWLLAFAGIIFKIFYIDKFPRTSLATYLLMGWLSILAMYQLYQVAPIQLLYLLVAGGLSYSIGTIFYAINKIPYNHAIWHIFVLAGAALHCWAIWQFVIP
ncbi:MAG: hemolysin III family protein [Gammaproteobacteria bacterium]|nr:hemolysin III family protein [Gammaproteobacteria bacterium]